MSARASACLAAVVLVGLACRQPHEDEPARADPRTTADHGAPDEGAGEADETTETGDALSGEAAHTIPFADRTSMGYLLMLPPSESPPEPPSRAFLAGLVEQSFPDRRHDGEIDLLLTLIATEPHTTDAGTLGLEGLLETGGEGTQAGDSADGAGGDGAGDAADDAAQERARVFDLIGLHIEIVGVGEGDDALIGPEVLGDPVLTRGLTAEQRASLPARSWLLLLRADYRNQHGVRGLRLHQTLVRLVADHYGAVIHDPDTLETMSVETFTARRLRASAGNVADQLAIVPFADPAREGGLRLATRGMRRFGAVDLELTGLDADPRQLQQATDLIAGLALTLVQEGEVDASGFAVEVPELLEIDRAQIERSYAKARSLSPCADCSAVSVHLVERPTEPHDPRDHVVARIVAPRSVSDAPDYDHPHWVRQSLQSLFGP